jgi:peptidoglycan/LPS O-acetylase OafA/YrhL
MAGIEGLRAVAALSVVLYHVKLDATTQDYTGPVGNVLAFTDQGLTLFFVLSGFLLFRPFASAALQDKPLPSVRRYAWNRFLRITPAYLVIFAVTALIIGTVYIQGSTHGVGPDNIGRLTDPGKILANILLVQTYIPSYVMSGLGVSWSLTAEIAFYVVLPLIAFLAARMVKSGRNKVVALCLAPGLMIAVGLAITIWAKFATRNLHGDALSDFDWGQTGSAVLQRSFFAQADLFAYGMLAALAVSVIHERGVLAVSSRVTAILVGSALILIAGAITILHPLVANLAGVASALIIVAVVLPSSGGESNAIARTLEWLPLRFTGMVSYSVYLWHLPVILWLSTHNLTVNAGEFSLAANMGLVLLIVLPLSAATYYLVERPAMQWKKRTANPSEVRQSASV